MTKLAAVLIALVLALAPGAPLAGAVTTSAGSAAPEESLALAMLRGLGGDRNTIVSPSSLYTALAMVDQGATAQTAAQIETVLGVTSPAQAAAVVPALHPEQAASGPTLASANGLWTDDRVHLDPSFASDLKRNFDVNPGQVDFAGDPDAAIDTINRWVNRHTAGQIPTLMSPGEVTNQTQLVLANALYLNARWATPFDPNQTRSGAFHAPSGTVSLPFMHSATTAAFPYARGSDYRAVALPYAHSSLQLLTVLPSSGAMNDFERRLTPAGLDAITGALRTRDVALALPRFSLASKVTLNGFLQRQGVTRAFSRDAQLTGMLRGRGRLAIQAVEQAATLTVAEHGTVAAAATGVSVAPTAVAADPIELTLNRPFLVFLRDARTGAILFSARVQDPATG